MGMRRRTRRRALVAGAAIAHNRSNQAAEQEQAGYEQGQADAQQAAAPAPQYQAPAAPAAPAPPPADPYDQIEHLAALHSSGALTDEEFAAEKAKVLAS
jgi:hypothetical protein